METGNIHEAKFKKPKSINTSGFSAFSPGPQKYTAPQGTSQMGMGSFQKGKGISRPPARELRQGGPQAPLWLDSTVLFSGTPSEIQTPLFFLIVHVIPCMAEAPLAGHQPVQG